MRTRRNRSFDFLYREICLALNRRIARYPLWLLISEVAANPNELSRGEVERFIVEGLPVVLERENKQLAQRAQKGLHKRLLAFDRRYPTPEEWLAELGRIAA